MVDNSSSTASPGPRPLWIPADLKFDTLPVGLQFAITEIVNPAYQELVLGAHDALQKAMGITFVHVLWLEMIELIHLGKEMARTLVDGQGTEPHQPKIAAHLRLLTQKEKLAKFFLEVRRLSSQAGPAAPARLP